MTLHDYFTIEQEGNQFVLKGGGTPIRAFDTVTQAQEARTAAISMGDMPVVPVGASPEDS